MAPGWKSGGTGFKEILATTAAVAAMALASPLPAQQEETLPRRPSSMIHDDDELLSAAAERLLSERLAAFDDAHNVSIYVYATRFVEKVDEKALASDMLAAWHQEESPAILALFEQLSNSMNYAYSRQTADRLGEGSLRMLLRDSVLYSSKALTDDNDYEGRVIAAVDRVMEQLEAQLPDRQNGVSKWNKEHTTLLLVFAAAAAVAAILFLSLWVLNRRSPPVSAVDPEGQIGPRDIDDLDRPPPEGKARFALPSGDAEISSEHLRRRKRLSRLARVRPPKSHIPTRKDP